MLDGQARLYAMQAARMARIPSVVDFGQIHAQADELAREWTPEAEYLGCTLLMLIRGAATDVYSALSYRSKARDDTRIFELPCPIDLRPSWPQRDVPLSGRIADVTEIGLSLETRIWIAVDADHDTLRFRVDADGPERSWQRNLQLVRGVLTDTEHGEIWDFRTDPAGT